MYYTLTDIDEDFISYDAVRKALISELAFNYVMIADDYYCLICGEPLNEKEIKYVIESDKDKICENCERLFP